MVVMKKHPEIFFDLQTSVKLSAKQEKKLKIWPGLASHVMTTILRDSKFINQQWLKNVTTIRVSVLICGEAKIKKLNQNYRDKNKVTDVLSFPSFSTLRLAPGKMDLFGDELFLGDLAICHQKVLSQAKDFEIDYFDEFIHLFFHGLIHLVGYDHEISLKEEKIMERWEEKALSLFSKAKKKGA